MATATAATHDRLVNPHHYSKLIPTLTIDISIISWKVTEDNSIYTLSS
jgi:hypothetical protein